MTKIEFKKLNTIFKKDGNKLGLKKRKELIKVLSVLSGSGVVLYISNKFLKMKNNIDRWSIWAIVGDGELNSYIIILIR